MDCVKSARPASGSGKVIQKVMLYSGFASGIVLTVMLGAVAWLAPGHYRPLLLVMIVGNIFMMVPWHRWTMPQWFNAGLAIARGFHWVVNLIFASLGLLLLTHAGHPKRALAFGALALMFVLWAGAARRLTYRGYPPDAELAITGA